jgi:type IV pilus assembly protein PilW
MQVGISLIELMVALLIASLLTLGLLQIFSATRLTSQMQEGLSRVQENGRFATQYLQRQLRMVGFMGCGADSGRIAQTNFVNHLTMFDGTVPGGNKYRFQRPLEAFSAGSGTPPDELAAVAFVDGSDVLIMRTFSDESVPVLSVSRDAMILNMNVSDGAAPFLPTSGSTALFALENCRSADVFAGTLTGSTLKVDGSAGPNVYMDPSVSGCGSSACPWDFRISNATLNSTPITGGPSRLNAEVHRAEYVALYVRNTDAGAPALYMQRFKRNDDGTVLADADENLVDGVENMQLRFGYDTSATPDGTIDEYRTAEDVVGGAASEDAIDANWRRVLSVRVALLLRSPDRAGVSGTAREYDLLGVTLTPPADGSVRQVYETTIALRNRLFNS